VLLRPVAGSAALEDVYRGLSSKQIETCSRAWEADGKHAAVLRQVAGRNEAAVDLGAPLADGKPETEPRSIGAPRSNGRNKPSIVPWSRQSHAQPKHSGLYAYPR
jgi:hypothetical protein